MLRQEIPKQQPNKRLVLARVISATLLPEYTGSLDRLTVAILYSEFIDLLLRREASKAARAAFSKDQRKRFATRLAYWMWQDDQRSDIDGSTIPDALFAGYLDKLPPDVRPVDIRRDLLSGAFLERKPPNRFYFPHRSFQEYLVADELAYMFETKDDRFAKCPYLTPEAASFFIEIIGKSGAIQLRKRWLGQLFIPDNIRELVNTSCAHYGLDLLHRPSADLSYEMRRRVSDEERGKLLRRLDVVGVVASQDDSKQGPQSAVKSGAKANRHRKGGVTPKHRYRRQ